VRAQIEKTVGKKVKDGVMEEGGGRQAALREVENVDLDDSIVENGVYVCLSRNAGLKELWRFV
jgi:hypothetical protein